MKTRELLDYYGRADVQEAMVSFGAGREVVGRRVRGDYNRRPDVLVYPEDVLRQAKGGAVSFHSSVELWKNPMHLSTELRQDEIADLRSGWDFLLDLDSSNLEHSKIAADLLVKALGAHSLRDVPVKFSGRAGFHIMVPFSTFPSEVSGKETRLLFPRLPRLLALYLQEFIREKFAEELVAREGSPAKFAEILGKSLSGVLSADKKMIDPFSSVKIDSILISPRHLVRMPYSFNEKSWLVSVPVKSREILSFSPESAAPEKVGAVVPFGKCSSSAGALVEAALIFERNQNTEEKKLVVPGKTSTSAGGPAGGPAGGARLFRIDEEFFPPCIKLVLSQKNVDDGRKRRLFILQSFLQRAGWSAQEIADKSAQWNSGISNPLQSVYLQGQVNYFSRQSRELMPPNCAADGFYRELGICKPDRFCEGVKNPITAASRSSKTSFFARAEARKREELKTKREKKAAGAKKKRQAPKEAMPPAGQEPSPQQRKGPKTG
jgi:hypothetical protein